MAAPERPDAQSAPKDAAHGPAHPYPRRRRFWARIGAWGLAVAAAVAGAVLAGRRSPSPVAGHAHTAGNAAPTVPRAVTLTETERTRIGVTLAAVTKGAMERHVRAVAQVTFDETRLATVAPKVDGWIERLYVDFTGKSVRRGDPLFSLYSPMIVSTQEELLLARGLMAEIGDADSSSRDGARRLLESARRRLRLWDVPLEAIEQLEETGQVQRAVVLRSPATGFVLEKSIQAGQRIMAGDPVLRIADLSTVWLEGEVFERDLPAVRLGERVSAEFPALPGIERSGRITYVHPILDPETRTARIRVELPNPDLVLKPGMYATIRFAFTSRTATLRVPRSAVLVTGQRNLVFVKRADGRFEPVDVVLGVTTEDRSEILRGLTTADTVVASGTFLLDAESNLGTGLGGMGNMPGMDVAVPPRGEEAAPPDHPANDSGR